MKGRRDYMGRKGEIGQVEMEDVASGQECLHCDIKMKEWR